MEYREIYEVRYTDPSGQEVTELRTDDKSAAIALRDELELKGRRKVHIQYSFKYGGQILRDGGILNISVPVGFRQNEFEKTAIIYGKEISIKMPNGETRRGQFAVVELDNILASHNEKTYGSTSGYPLDANGENVNDRNYTGDVSSQSKIIDFAQNLEPDRLITTSRTPSGSPIITKDGIVVSGNNRTMSLKLSVQDYPERYDEYKRFLLEESEAFGFKSSVIGQAISNSSIVDERHSGETFRDNKYIKFNHPVLVRFDYDFPDYNALELSKYNKDTKKSERPIDKALKLGKILESSERCTSIISNIVGKYETFSEFYSNRSDQKSVKDTLIDCNILTTQEIPAYFSEAGFTEQGKELIENLLAGLVLSKDALIASNEGGAKIFRQTIITSLPVLTANKALPENSLNDSINNALLLQSRISSSKTSFQDLVSQTNIFGENIDEETMYLNRLLAAGRNTFKKSIEGYNASVIENQGASLFGSKPTKDEIFTAHIKSKIDPEDKKIIEKSLSLQPVNTPVNTTDKPVEIIKKTVPENLFISGNFFKFRPENILAEMVPAFDRWKKPITEYKGSLEDVKRIDASLTFLKANQETIPLLSVVKEPVRSATETNVAVVDNLINAIEVTKSDVQKKSVRKQKVKSNLPASTSTRDTESYTVREVWDMLNPEVSIDELRAFMWWKNSIGRPIKSQNWLEIANITEAELYGSNALVRQWVGNGLLYYFDGALIPAYLYLAENVYDKKTKLVKAGDNSGEDGEYILKTYGQTVYDNQVNALEKVFRIQYDKRLMIKSEKTADGEELIINPVSKFAREFKIKTLADGNPFKWKRITAGTNKRFGKPDFLATNVSNKDLVEFEELSLTDAFCYWLRTDDTIQFQKGINYADVIKIYVQSANSPATTAVKDADGRYTGDQLILKKKQEADWERLKSKTKTEGDRLFLVFLDQQLTLIDKTTIETQWNRDFNGYVKINYNKVPVAFPCNRYDMGQPMTIKPEKREAVAFTFSEGSGLLAYDVGVGKTPSAIFTICQFIETGYASRPLLIVPNQTYKQWISEFKKFAAHIPINEFYNLDASYIEDWKDVNGVTKKVAPGSVSIITYEGMVQLGFNEDTIERIKPGIGAILFQQTEGLSEKKKDRKAEALNSKIEEMVGRLLAKTSISIEELGFDFISFDEAHACKKVFTTVAGEREENLGNTGKETQTVSRYKIQSGAPSTRGVKGFMLCQYIQSTYSGNTLLLTATPFTNSPLEIYSMLAMVAHNKLKAMNLDNLNTFFDTFVATSYEMIINSRLKPERRQIILGFNNLISLQTLIRRFMNYKTGEEVNVPRPNKIVLPLRSKLIDGLRVALSEDEKVETILPLTPLQAQLMEGIKQYANGVVDEQTMCSGALLEEDENEDVAVAEGVEIDEDVMTSDEKIGVRMLKAMNHARNLALSPYIFSCSGLGTPTAEEYINTSNKLTYVMEAIRTIKAYHEAEGTDMSGIVIYMDRGVEYFKLIREYLIKNVGFQDHEVGIISSKIITPVAAKTPKDEQKEYVKNLFLGQRFNKETLEMETLTGAERCKIVIGSSTIKEGINLQKHSSVLFNCWMDWNPTDIQQLEGRIYRQGNKFKTVRIVNPLMIDSMDIFMFQKLEEKTSRINTIWSNEGMVNVLKTEEFNPKDLKYSLIRDAHVLAEMDLLEVGEKISEDIADLENKIKRNKKIQDYVSTIQRYTDRLASELQEYRPLAEGQPQRSLDSMLRLFQEVLKKQTDAEGKKMEYLYSRDKNKPADYYSKLTPVTKPYWFDELNYANRGVIHETRGYLVPNGVTINDLDDFTLKIEKQIAVLQGEKIALTSEDAINNRAMQIQIERDANKVEERSVFQCVEDFKKLNYLLSDLAFAPEKIKVTVECPPLDENGDVRIDSEGLALLDDCVLHDPDTKRMHTNEAGEYTAERRALHDFIIKDLTKSAVCIQYDQPIAILTGGAPGSGKSTFLNKYAPYLQSDKIWKVDADLVRDYLPEYKGWNSANTHQEARDIVNELITTFDVPCKHDLLYDGTMSNSAKYIPLIRRLKSIGYKVFIAYMDVPKEISIERALNRFKKRKLENGKTGRYVPIKVIDDFFRTGKTGLEEIKNSVDGYVVVDSITQKIIEKGGENIPADRSYSDMFVQGKELETAIQSSVEVLKSRLKLLKRMPQTPIIKARIKIVQRMIEQAPVKKQETGGKVSIPGIHRGTVITKDGVTVKKASNEYKGHIFYDEHGNQFKCLGYYPKLEECVYLDLQTGNEVVGCMDGFYYNNPTKK